MHPHEHYIRLAIEAAQAARAKGNLPFGCVLVDATGNVLAIGENSINTSRDSIAHAEINLLHGIAGRLTREFLHTCTLYATDEPCPMCTSAIYWSGVGKIVFGLRKSRYYEITGRDNPDYVFEMPCEQLLQHGGRPVLVEGPVLEDEVLKLHQHA